MRIAILSDIHANLPALEACLRDIAQQDVDAIFCLGDLVGYNVWPNEVIERLRAERIPTIAGNYDVGIGQASDDCGCAYKTAWERQLGKQSIAYTNAVISDNNRDYLRTLPAHVAIEHRTREGDIWRILLVHGSPRRVNSICLLIVVLTAFAVSLNSPELIFCSVGIHTSLIIGLSSLPMGAAAMSSTLVLLASQKMVIGVHATS